MYEEKVKKLLENRLLKKEEIVPCVKNYSVLWEISKEVFVVSYRESLVVRYEGVPIPELSEFYIKNIIRTIKKFNADLITEKNNKVLEKFLSL